MDIIIRQLGRHRGAPRLYLDTPALSRAGFESGAAFQLRAGPGDQHLVIEACPDGTHRVSGKTRGARRIPVIDLNSHTALACLATLERVRVVIRVRRIHILALASHARAAERLQRLEHGLAAGHALRTASVAFGAGITSWALHQGLHDGGVDTTLVLANEIDQSLTETALSNHPLIGGHTVTVQAPMQEAVTDAWLLQTIGPVDLLEAGIPCSGASRAGVAKRGLKRMEDHPLVGHLVAAVIQWIAALQPALFVAENVPDYVHSASASLLVAWLRDAGYQVQHIVLDATDFGSLEGRRRWFLVAHPPEVTVDLGALRGSAAHRPTLADVLDTVPEHDPAWRPVAYLKRKQDRDAEKGSGFAMQWMSPGAQRIPTLRKGYHKGGSTDPRLRHPSDPQLSRLLTAAEHARIKGIPPTLLAGLSPSAMHEACGQSVDTRPVIALGRLLGQALRAARRKPPLWRREERPSSALSRVSA